jgi:hypothetical protein
LVISLLSEQILDGATDPFGTRSVGKEQIALFVKETNRRGDGLKRLQKILRVATRHSTPDRE